MTIEFLEDNNCPSCEGKGYHIGCNIDGGLRGEDIDSKMTFIQKCLECDKYSSDWYAAVAYTNEHNTLIQGVLIER